jgi:hypothetical protein
MTNPQKVYDFLKKNPRQMFCDDCLEKKTGVDRHVRAKVQQYLQDGNRSPLTHASAETMRSGSL